MMEQLKELEQVQNVMLKMQSVGAIDSSNNNNNADSNRFLANFILFMIGSNQLSLYVLGGTRAIVAGTKGHDPVRMSQLQELIRSLDCRAYSLKGILIFNWFGNVMLKMQPCGELDMNQKCKLISESLPKISSAFLEDALCQLYDKGNFHIEDSMSHHCEDEKGLGLLHTDSEDVAMIALDSMQRANSTLEDFCRSYFMFHDMDANSAESIFKYLPLLSFTESYIYQLDTINEKLLQYPDFDRRPDRVANSSWVLRFVKSFRTDAFRPLAVLLERYGMFTDRIRDELKCGEEYWALERKLCRALTNKQEIQVEDIMKAIHLKSFDYRVLNLLLYHLNGKEINEVHMEFLSVSEFLVEVADDLLDDVLENNFNILRMFVRIYGASSAPAFLVSYLFDIV
ncbi:hypothetical protein OSB04_000680 [Centaurea solstitialis]|uniref:Uncharacterized protein n=1 Tax=Centaurea solstitialis TaxID=347529 RepID=A0AA38TRC4_9ASTR|nr:hypothetical protein OSB04_000680 [Centaurea solstitialis]